MRITNPAARVGTAVIVALVVLPLSMLPTSIAESIPSYELTVDTGLLSAVLFLVLTLAGVAFCARTFRGAAEGDRPWWQMTEGAVGGLFLGGLFLTFAVVFGLTLQETVSYALQFGDPDWGRSAVQQSVYLATFVIAGLAFTGSAVRLVVNGRRARRALPLAA